MSRPLKIILVTVGLVVGLLVGVAVALLVFDPVGRKTRAEAAASAYIGMDVRVEGQVLVDFFPLRIVLEDVYIRNRGVDVATAGAIRLGVDLLALLWGQLRVDHLALERLRLSIVRGDDGTLNVAEPRTAAQPLPSGNLAHVSLTQATLVYSDSQSGGAVQAEECNVQLRDLRLAEGNPAEFMRRVSFAAEGACTEVRRNGLSTFDVKLSVHGNAGIIDLQPVTMVLFGGQGTGDVRADYSGAVPRYAARYTLTLFQIEEFFNALWPRKVAQGQMTLSTTLSMQGSTFSDMRRSLQGQVSLRGENLMLLGTDIDQTFSDYESSQNFNLVDLGAFLFAGPLGLIVTKGYNFAGVVQGSEGTSEIRTLVSHWQVDDGVARAQDVAMATNENRIALRGELDFGNRRFQHVTVALIDTDGCALVQQELNGPFENPAVEKPSILTSLAGPALGLLKKGRELFADGECEVFYQGTVMPQK